MPKDRSTLETEMAGMIRTFLAEGGDVDDVETTLERLGEEFIPDYRA